MRPSSADADVADTLLATPGGGAAGPAPLADGRYELLRLLGRGGQSEVFVAFDRVLGREVAFKTPHAPARASGEQAVTSETEARFVREARITAKLDHPNVITVHEIGQLPDGRRFCTMRLVTGEGGAPPRTLGAAMREATTLRARLALLPRFLEACHGVAHAHARGVAHRDLKPDNVALGRQGETVVLDWGLARDMHGDDLALEGAPMSPAQTADGQVFGTPLYMSPEHALGQRALVDERSDVWCLGAMLFELLTGRTPFTGGSLVELLDAVRSGPVVDVRALEPDVPRALAAVVARALSRDRAARYATAGALAEDLAAFLEHRQVGVYDYSFLELTRLFLQRYRTTALVAGVSFALVVAALLALAVSNERAKASLAEAFIEKGRLAEANLAWDRAAVWYAAALEQQSRRDAALGVRLAFDRASASPVTVLGRHASGVRTLVASADGRWLASGGTDKVILVWDVARRALTRRLEGHVDTVTGLAFAKDGTLYSVSEDRTARRWAPGATTGEVLTTFADRLNAVSLRPDGAQLACANENGDVGVIALPGREVQVLGRHPHPVYALAYSPDGRVLASASWLGETRRWDVASGALLETATHHSGSVLAMAWSPDGRQLATAGRDTSVHIVAADAPQTERVRVLTGHTQKVYGLAWSSDGVLLASVGTDGTSRIWNTQNGAPLRGLSLGQDDEAFAAAFVPGTELFAWAGASGEVFLRRVAVNLTGATSWQAPTLPLTPEGNLVMPTFQGFSIVDFRTIEERAVATQSDAMGRLAPVSRLAVSHSGAVLAGSCSADCLAFWDLREGKLLGRVAVPGLALEGLAFSPDDRVLVTVGRDGFLRVWDVATRTATRELRPYETGAFGADFSPDGRLLATSGYDRHIILWDTRDYSEVRRMSAHEHGVRTVVFSPDGTRLASASWDRSARLWDVATGAELARYRHRDFVFGVAFRQDGAVLATGSHDGTVRLWDTRTHHEELRFQSDEAAVTVVRFVPDGSLFYAGRGLHRVSLDEQRPLPSLEAVLRQTGLELDGLSLRPAPKP